ncbi:MAG TPA: hypothetical protein VLC46_24080 [Thermoanaerobaculia bacterium]|nr:hypothetical protein [Thermoanaerobaculia bacterium]
MDALRVPREGRNNLSASVAATVVRKDRSKARSNVLSRARSIAMASNRNALHSSRPRRKRTDSV